jgi:hypothetical protein
VELADKVRRIALDRLHLPEHELFLDTPPIFTLIANPAATNGIRRFAFHWQKPTTGVENPGQNPPEISISAEVDAVSGDIKALNFLHKWFRRPDPESKPPTSSGQ